MKLKLKCLLLTEDGKNWICIRQYYATDLKTNEFLEQSFQGMRLKTVDEMEEKNGKYSSNQER
jgi:hypothetical protein